MSTAYNPRNYVIEPQSAPVGDLRVVPVDLIRPNPWNYNVQSDATFNKTVESIRKFGFVDPCTVRPIPNPDGGEGEVLYQIIDGEHRWKAAKMVGMKEITVIDLGAFDDEKAKQLTIILNDLGGSPDQVRLAELLRDINVTVPAEELALVMPFAEPELRMYLDVVDFSFESATTTDTRRPEEQKDEEEIEEPQVTGKKGKTFFITFDTSTKEKKAAVKAMVAQLKAVDEDMVAAISKLATHYQACQAKEST